MPHTINKSQCEYLRTQAKQKFDKVRSTWIDAGKWVLPYRINWLLSQTQGERNNQHIVDTTHVLGLRAFVAGFLEGNTSASRPWYRLGTGDPDQNLVPENHQWLDYLTRQTLKQLSNSNFYNAAGSFYYDYGTFNTGAHYIDERRGGFLFFHTLTPGSYYIINNAFGEAVCLVREMSLNVKALVGQYGKKVNGKWDWSNFSSRVQKMYDDGNYSQLIDIVEIVEQNNGYDVNGAQAGSNRQWVSVTYELGGDNQGPYYQDGQSGFQYSAAPKDKDKYLRIKYSKRKPFIVGKSHSSGSFEYGEKGPTTDALGLIKSLNKKAISKDVALDKMLDPTMQGPANVRKSYLTTASRGFVPLDPNGVKNGGLSQLYQLNPGIGALMSDVEDMRQQVNGHYFVDYLLYLTANPKTRTATETDAIIQEQERVIGPNLQALNTSYNLPLVEYVTDYVLDNDPYLPPAPDALQEQFLRPEFISVFAQAQRAADLPAIDRYMMMISQVGQLNPDIWFKANLDKLADLYEDRLYLPAGLNNPTEKAEALKQQAKAQFERKQQVEQLAQMAGAAKDASQARKGEGR